MTGIYRKDDPAKAQIRIEIVIDRSTQAELETPEAATTFNQLKVALFLAASSLVRGPLQKTSAVNENRTWEELKEGFQKSDEGRLFEAFWDGEIEAIEYEPPPRVGNVLSGDSGYEATKRRILAEIEIGTQGERDFKAVGSVFEKAAKGELPMPDYDVADPAGQVQAYNDLGLDDVIDAEVVAEEDVEPGRLVHFTVKTHWTRHDCWYQVYKRESHTEMWELASDQDFSTYSEAERWIKEQAAEFQVRAQIEAAHED